MDILKVEDNEKDLFKCICEYVCGSDTQEPCKYGIFPDCKQYWFGCYKLLRETEKRIDALEDIKKILDNLYS